MKNSKPFDVIIIGGSYAGLAAAMALGRALKNVLVIDSGLPCNRQTPCSHNFLTHDGQTPAQIASIARQQVLQYNNVEIYSDVANNAIQVDNGFQVQTASGRSFHASKLIFATGIRDILLAIKGLSECWGISVLHCPFCHGYEVRGEATGVLGNGDNTFEQVKLISNWTKNITIFTNGPSNFSPEQNIKLLEHKIKVAEDEIKELQNMDGNLEKIIFNNGSSAAIQTLYTKAPFEQHCKIPQSLGCELTDDGYIKINSSFETTIKGVYACGDNVPSLRTVANAVAMGTAAGINVSRQFIFDRF